MGTSKSFSTPGGGVWTNPKRQLTVFINGRGQFDGQRFVRDALRALGGVGMKPRMSADGYATPYSGGGGRSGGGNSGQSGGGALSDAVRGIGGFGTQIASGGLGAALASLGLGELRGRPAVEVIAKIAEHLSESATGRQAEVMETALRETILDIAEIEGEGAYEDLEGALQGFLEREGVEGFVEVFLSQYVFSAVWSYFENHAKAKMGGGDEELTIAVESACRSLVAREFESVRETERFERIDWFGQAGWNFADRIVNQLQSGMGGLE